MRSGPFLSQENYFPILGSNASALQNLESTVLVNINAFYSFMKAVRDSCRQVYEATDAEQWNERTIDVIYMLYLGLESGRRATQDLVEFDATYVERTVVILISELEAYRILRLRYNCPHEMHHRRLILRARQYDELMARLRPALDARQSCVDDYLRPGKRYQPSFEECQWRGAIRIVSFLLGLGEMWLPMLHFPFAPGPGVLLWGAPVCGLMAYFIYRLSLPAHVQFGELFKATFDQYRGKLAFEDVAELVGTISGDATLGQKSLRERNKVVWRYLRWHLIRDEGRKKNLSVEEWKARVRELG